METRHGFLTSEDFGTEIRRELEAGRGFIPLIGSGMSVASGIPIMSQLADYLTGCLGRASDPGDDWSPGCGGPWPSFTETSTKLGWTKEYCQDTPLTLERRQALAGALSDWQTALQILSRFSKRDGRISIGPPVSAVIDSFFAHFTRSAEPNLAHLMLAQLADALRITTVLTTNFDLLVERAFARLGMPLASFDVHQRAPLPPAELVLAQRSIVKLHGSRFGLRADFSLEQESEQADKETFGAYVGGHPDAAAPRHFLVVGTSFAERRTVALVKSVLKAARPDADNAVRLFWVRFGDERAPAARNKCIPADLRDCEKSIVYTSQSDLGLWLLSLYQQHYRALPPAGAAYKSILRVPPGSYSGQTLPDRSVVLDQVVADCVRDLKAVIDPPTDPPGLVVVRSAPGIVGVSSVAAQYYAEADGPSRQCAWIDLDQCGDLEQFLVATRDEVLRKLGRSSSAPPVPRMSPQVCEAHLRRPLQDSGLSFLVFVNTREGLGTDAGTTQRENDDDGWPAAEVEQLWDALRLLARPRLRFVVLASPGLKTPDWAAGLPTYTLSKVCITLDADAIAKGVVDWLHHDEPERDTAHRFVYAMTLMRHSRHWAALYSWAFIKAPSPNANVDNDDRRGKLADGWLKELRERLAIRSQPGGCEWMHIRVRIALRAKLEQPGPGLPPLAGLAAECHQGLADWYVKLFRSSQDPHAALESLNHRLWCSRAARDGVEDKTISREDGRRLQATAMIEALDTLRLAREPFLSCGYFGTFDLVVSQIADEADRDEQYGGKELARQCRELLADYCRNVTKFARMLEVGATLEAGGNPPAAPQARGVERHDLEVLYRAATAQTAVRSYQTAEATFGKLFEALGLDVPAIATRVHKDTMQSVRDVGRDWLKVRQNQGSGRLATAVRSLRHYMWLQMLRGQLDLMAHPGRGLKGERQSHQYAERLCTLATELMRYCRDHDLLQKENGFLRTHLGVALARLNRFHEAHRRLNEASGYLSHSRKAGDAMAWAVIDLRRAEAFLTQFEGCEATDGNQVRRNAHRQDATSALRRAQERLVGHRQDVWWWTLLYELEMRTLAGRAESDPAGSAADATDLLSRAQLLIHVDVWRQARLTRLYHDVLERAGDPRNATKYRDAFGQACGRLEEILEERQKQPWPPLDDGIRVYAEQCLALRGA